MKALFVIGLLCQLKGTSKNCDKNRSSTFKPSKLKLKQLKTILKDKGEKEEIHKFAPKFATDIFELMKGAFTQSGFF